MDSLATCPNGTIIDFSAVMDCWKAESAARLKRSTAAEYAAVAERRIRPRLGALPAGDVGQAEASKLIGGLNDAGLAPSTVRLAASVLQSILDYRGQCGVAAGAVKVSRPPEGRTEARVLDASEQAGEGFHMTYPANSAIPSIIEIDHIVYSKNSGITVSSLQTVEIAGTDHQALLATLEAS